MYLRLISGYLCLYALVFGCVRAQGESAAAAVEVLADAIAKSAKEAALPDLSTESSDSTTTTTTASGLAVSANAAATKRPKKYFTVAELGVCKYSSPDFSNCVKNLIQESMRRLKDGDRELNIPVIDPFRLNRTTFQYTNGNARGRIIMHNALAYGFSKMEIKMLDLKVKDGKTKMRVMSHVPEVRIAGNYKAELLLNNVQLRPRGEFNVSLINVNIEQTSEGGFYESDGHRFVRLTKFDANPKVEDFKLLASGVFPDPTLNELAVNIVNQYWRQIFNVFLPETRQYWAPMLLRQLNQIMSIVPYDVFVVD